MKARISYFVFAAALVLSASASAQMSDTTVVARTGGTTAQPATDSIVPAKPAKVSTMPVIEIQHLRPADKRGINIFETPKHDDVPFNGFRLSWGAAFTQQYQALDHENAADAKVVSGVNQNQLMSIGGGFNNATANLYLNAQLAPGIRVALTSYLSSRHHNETWVKDGYLLIDDSPLDIAPLEKLMEYVTLKVGHFEVNYGDAHFRRSDNGNAMYNPFVGNLILDAFTTEIGGEVYVRAKGMLAMAAITGGEIRGQVASPDKRSGAYFGKLGYDSQINGDLRLRLTGSAFSQKRSVNNTLYAGDRAGSRYYVVMENTASTESANASSGLINPGFRSKIKAYQINPFLKYKGLEVFGVAEKAQGRAATETKDRRIDQYSGEAVYRFLKGEKLYAAGRYNTVEGELSGIANEVSVNRSQFGGGWFVTGNVLLKAEYVTQKYYDFPTSDIRSGGKFNGFMLEGVVAF